METKKNITTSVKNNEIKFFPLSDINNTGNWVLNTEASDEFDTKTIDEDKWYIVWKFKD